MCVCVFELRSRVELWDNLEFIPVEVVSTVSELVLLILVLISFQSSLLPSAPKCDPNRALFCDLCLSVQSYNDVYHGSLLREPSGFLLLQ